MRVTGQLTDGSCGSLTGPKCHPLSAVIISEIFGLDFRTQSPFTRSGFKMKQHVGKLKHPREAPVIFLRFDSDTWPTPSLILTATQSQFVRFR